MEWETASIPDLVTLTNQHVQTLDESPKKIAKFLNLQLWQMKFPKQKQNLPVSAVIAKSQETGGGDCYKCKPFWHLQPSNQPFHCSPNSKCWTSEQQQILFQFLLNQLRETSLQMGNEIYLNGHWSHTLGTQSHCYKAAPALKY